MSATESHPYAVIHNLCGGVAYYIDAPLEYSDRIASSRFSNVDRTAVEENSEIVCGVCGARGWPLKRGFNFEGVSFRKREA